MGLFFNSNSVFSKLTNLVLHMFQFYDFFVSLFVKFILSNLDLCFGEFVMSTNSLHNPQQEDDNKQKQANHPLFVVLLSTLSLIVIGCLLSSKKDRERPYHTKQERSACLALFNQTGTLIQSFVGSLVNDLCPFFENRGNRRTPCQIVKYCRRSSSLAADFVVLID